jgi:hypothetical protein
LLASSGMAWVIENFKAIVGQGVLGFGLLVLMGAGCYVGLLLIFDAIFMASQARIMIRSILNSAREPFAE